MWAKALSNDFSTELTQNTNILVTDHLYASETSTDVPGVWSVGIKKGVLDLIRTEI